MTQQDRAPSQESRALARSLSRTRLALPNLPYFLVFLAFVVARYIQINERLDILKTLRFEFLLGGLAIALAIAQLVQQKPDFARSRTLIVAILLLFACILVQLPFAADPVLARTVFWDRVVKFSMLTFLIAVMVNSAGYLRLFIGTFLFAIFYVTLESVEGLISGGLVWENQGVMRLHGAVPIYTHPNSLGGVSLGPLPYVIFLWSVWRRWYVRLGLLAVATTSLVCIVYSGSRTAYVGLLGLGLWVFLVSRRKLRLAVQMICIGLVVLMVVPQQYIERFQSIGGQEKAGSSKNTRIEILQDASTIFLENPLGVGVASFPAKRMERFGRLQDTHNLYLEVATNLGAQGLVVFALFVGTMLNSLWRSKRSMEDGMRRLSACVRAARPLAPLRRAAGAQFGEMKFLVAIANATSGFIVLRLIVGLFGMDLYEIYWWFGAGIAVALIGLSQRTQARNSQLMLAIDEEAGYPAAGSGPDGDAGMAAHRRRPPGHA